MEYFSMTGAPPCWTHALGIFGIIISLHPLAMMITPGGKGVSIRNFAMQGAAWMAIYSALVWLINAISGEPYTNAMAATYAASAALFTSASFELEGNPGLTCPAADRARIIIAYAVASILPPSLSLALWFSPMEWTWSIC